MVEEGGEVGGAGLELLDAVKAVALAVGLQHKRPGRSLDKGLFEQRELLIAAARGELRGTCSWSESK